MKLVLPGALAILFTAACDTPHTHVYRYDRTYYTSDPPPPAASSTTVDVYAPAYNTHGGYIRPPEDEQTHMLGVE